MAKCKGICKKQESDAQLVKVTSVKKLNDLCPDLSNEDAQDYIENDVLNDQKGVIDLSDCHGDCHCEWDPPPPWPNKWTKTPFDWQLTLENDLSCKYEVEGTVETKVRVIEGKCTPRVVKGGSTHKWRHN